MILPLLLAAATPETAIDAERAFDLAAQSGQWTAFRRFMADDATVFTPQPVKAKDALPVKEPPISLQWWPADSYVSCDGNLAVNTGPWVGSKGFGYFTTVWVRQSDGHFKWVMDGGDTLTKPLSTPEKPRIHKASCNAKPEPSGLIPTGRGKLGTGSSSDSSLSWAWVVLPDGARDFQVWQWNGRTVDVVLHQEIAAPK